ncbi:MAG: hypothetical protein DRN20_05750, partial [Thermoplasmata archaeon]
MCKYLCGVPAMEASDIKAILKSLGLKPSRRKGQSFLLNESVLRREVAYAHVGSKDTVLEVGGGIGLLTKILAQHAR